MLSVMKLTRRPKLKVKSRFKEFLSTKSSNFSCFFGIFRIFRWSNLKFRKVKVDNGLLQDISTFLTFLRAKCIGNSNRNTQTLITFHNSFQSF